MSTISDIVDLSSAKVGKKSIFVFLARQHISSNGNIYLQYIEKKQLIYN